jgi:NADH-ubiquinone oxidoreductase chain 5
MFIIGWDGLGISSLFLIILYPNKTRLFNSFLTFFFNRLGDLFLILFFCIVWRKMSSIFFFDLQMNMYSFPILFICLLTKRAQIPFSRWLPAAMSAPTPISAIVHSSTLVTAGILIFFKAYWVLVRSRLCKRLLLISSLTFILGGILASVEKDSKKIVAFSTISQIRMILFFIRVGNPVLALSHTFCHALFKTLLFCGFGVIFVWGLRDQMKASLKRGPQRNILSLLIFLSLFRMRGMVYSRSFFSKDCILEMISSLGYFHIYFVLFLGRVFTLIYSRSLFSRLKILPSSFQSFFMSKHYTFYFIAFFALCAFTCLKSLKILALNNFSFFLSPSLLFLINVVLFLFLVLPKLKASHFWLYCRRSVFHMKESFFSSFSLSINASFFRTNLIDHLFFKPLILPFKNIRLILTNLNTLIFSLVGATLLLTYSYSLIWT